MTPTTPSVSHRQYAGFWQRAIACSIDSLILMVPMCVLMGLAMVSLLRGVLGNSGFALVMALVFFVAGIGCGFVYYVAYHASRGATPGKKMLGLRVVDADTYGPISTGQAVGRQFGYVVSSFVWCLGFLWAAWDKRKQAWHDKLARTVVIVE